MGDRVFSAEGVADLGLVMRLPENKARTAEIERLKEEQRQREGQSSGVVERVLCPRPANNRPDGFSVGECVRAGECGCDDGVVWQAARASALEEAAKVCGWYAEKAEAIARYLAADPPKPEAVMAVVTELGLDAGKRAAAIRAAIDAARAPHPPDEAPKC